MIKRTKAATKPVAKTAKRTVVKKPTSTRPPVPTWQAPVDFKPFFLEVVVKTDKDGLLAPAIKATRYQGRYNPDADERKKFDVSTYDQTTLMGILSRLSMVTFVTNQAKRLPANQIYRIVIRVMKKSKDNSIGTRMTQIERITRMKSGRVKSEVLDKTDLDYRKFRKAFRCILPCAFQSVLLPPKRTRNSRASEES